MKAVIGALRAVLGLDSTAFEKGIGASQKQIAAFNRDFQKMAKSMERVGARISIGISAPAAAAKAAALKTAADFEEGMNRVQAATGATADEFQRLEDMARKIGTSSAFGASEASSAMEALAKNGLNVGQILGGAADATVKLAAANGAQLAPAADIVTDVMQQFGKTAADLQGVVDNVTGTLIASKFGFDDYRLAIGQAGGVAGKIGVKFEDFNAALAVTSSSFASGSDAGTSFKTFLTRLVPQSDEAKKAMELLGLSFFDGKGNMVDMAEAAQRLQKALAPLAQQSKIEAVTKIFGTDALRTALALADAGAAGVRKMADEIAKASAADQAAVRLKGFNGAVRELKGSLEGLGIAIGKSGLLDTATRWTKALTSLTRTLTALNPEVLKFTSIVLGVAAALGPTIVVVAQVMKVFGSALLTLSRMAPALAALAVAAAPLLGTIAILGALAGAVALFGDKIQLFTSDNGVAVMLSDVLGAIGEDFRMVGGWALDAGKMFLDGLGMIGSAIAAVVPGLGDLTTQIGDLMGALDIGDILRRVFVDPLDFALNSVVALITATVVAFKTLPAAVMDILTRLANVVGEKMTAVVNAGVEKLNWLREKIGNDPLPLLKWNDFVNDNEGAADRAGKSIALAFAQSMSGSIVQQTIDRLRKAAVGKAIAREVQQQIDQANPNQDFLNLNDPQGKGTPMPSGPPGGGKVLDFGTGESKKSAAEKLKEYIDSIAREAELLKMSNKARAEAEALDKAEAIAKEGKIKLTDADTEAIKRNVAAQLAAKEVADERTRLEALAKSTYEDTRTAQEKYTKAVADLDTLLKQGLITQDTYNRGLKVLKEELAKHAEGLEGQLEQISTAITDAAKDAAQELLNTDKSFGEILQSMLKRFSQFALQMFLFEPLFKSLGDGIKSVIGGAIGAGAGGSSGGIGGFLGKIGGIIGGWFGGGSSGGMSIDQEIAQWSSYGGARAGGGNVSPGNWYSINERGLEAFVPDVPGRIMTHRELMDSMSGGGGPSVVNQSIVIKTPDAGSFRRSERQTARGLKRMAGV